ncbi:MAG: hypothetical protein RMN51_07030 [Verrucomicrobiota bacterium]|nr:hypothetical protein [Limisphaera sp.]MDW8381845.1 hypothetical protein [Verrucomicrobiota bacterium]
MRDRPRIQAAILLNQLAMPGLGSWWAGYRWTGLAQMLLAGLGFTLVVIWFGDLLEMFVKQFGTAETIDRETIGWSWLRWGCGLFLVAWFWAGYTSYAIWRQAGGPVANGRSDRPPA